MSTEVKWPPVWSWGAASCWVLYANSCTIDSNPRIVIIVPSRIFSSSVVSKRKRLTLETGLERRIWKLKNFRESVSFTPNTSTLENILPAQLFEMIQKRLMMSLFLLMFFPKSICRIHWPGHNVLIPNGFDHFALSDGCSKWKTFETMWQTLLAFSRLKCLKPNRACFLNNSEIM